MSTGQSYPGKGGNTTQPQQNSSSFEQTVNSTPQTANSATSDLSPANKWLTLDLGLSVGSSGISEVNALYWVLEDTIHESLCKIEKDALQEDERETTFEDIRKYQDIKSSLFTSLTTRLNVLIAQIDAAAINQYSSNGTGQVAENPVQTAQINGLQHQVDTLEEELTYFKQLTLKQAELIGKGSLLQHVNGSTSGEGNTHE